MGGSDLIAVIVGGAIGIAGSIVPHLWTQSRARASARATARAYVSAILEMEKIRQHGASYRASLNALRSGSSQSLLRIFGSEDEHPDAETQKALVGQLGFLDANIAADLVLFCTMLAGLRVDLKAIALGQLDDKPIADKIRLIELDLKLWDDTQALGRAIIGRLSAPATDARFSFHHSRPAAVIAAASSWRTPSSPPRASPRSRASKRNLGTSSSRSKRKCIAVQSNSIPQFVPAESLANLSSSSIAVSGASTSTPKGNSQNSIATP
jgi:hypothetical protein